MIDRRRAEIEQRWLERVQTDVARRHVDPTELRDAIGDYLAHLADALRSGSELPMGGSGAWAEAAQEHAVTRVRLGFDIGQLVSEFVLLRRVLTEVAREEGLLHNEGQTERLAEVIEAAIAVSVGSYVESRDEAARRAQAEYIGFLTHELRNPLSTAMMAASQLRRRLHLPAVDARILELLEAAHRRLRDLIDEVLLTERFEAGDVEVLPAATTLGQVIDTPVAVARESAEGRGLAFAARYDATVRLEVDPRLTASALQSLAENAVKFTDQGGVSVEVEDYPREVVVHVRDTGPGLAPEELHVVFQPFRRARDDKPGSGLGLAIARRSVELQGGTIHAESTSGGGSHFWFNLPKQVQPKAR